MQQRKSATTRCSGVSAAPSSESFTHGTSAQRVSWFKRGIESGELNSCDTFGADKVASTARTERAGPRSCVTSLFALIELFMH